MIIKYEGERRRYNSRTEYRINTETSEFCCDKLKKAIGWEPGYGFSVNKDDGHPMIRLCYNRDYYEGDEGEDYDVDFCMFCGTKINVKDGGID